MIIVCRVYAGGCNTTAIYSKMLEAENLQAKKKNGYSIRITVLMWCERGDSNPHGITTRTSNVLVYHSNTLASA